MKLRTTCITKSQRHNDRHLFDDILTYTSSLLSRKKLLACRLYLQINLLSDIINLKGTALISNIMIGIRNTNTHHTSSSPLQKSLTLTLGNYGTVYWEVSTSVPILPYNSRNHSIFKVGYPIVQWFIDISIRQPLRKSSNINTLFSIAVLSTKKCYIINFDHSYNQIICWHSIRRLFYTSMF